MNDPEAPNVFKEMYLRYLKCRYENPNNENICDLPSWSDLGIEDVVAFAMMVELAMEFNRTWKTTV